MSPKHKIDEFLVKLQPSTHIVLWLARLAIFFDYFYFGALKLTGQSPANGLVTGLQLKTLPFIDSDLFLIILGVSECLIGVAFLWPKVSRYIVPVMLGHMLTTFLPLLFLPELTWQSLLIPTLAGQYIMKNLTLVALAIFIFSQAHEEETLI